MPPTRGPLRVVSALLCIVLSAGQLLAQAETPAAPPPTTVARAPRVELFPLADVRLLDGPFKHAQNLDRTYLLALDLDRLLVPFRVEAGLPARAPKYPNWESTGLDGHTTGHVLTALAQLAEGEQQKDRLA